MSERGSFVTEYVYCSKCFEVLRRTLMARDSSLCTVQVPSWDSPVDMLPVLAGKVGSTYPGGELLEMEARMRHAVPKLCHSVRIAVLAESGGEILVFGDGPAAGPPRAPGETQRA